MVNSSLPGWARHFVAKKLNEFGYDAAILLDGELDLEIRVQHDAVTGLA